MYGLVLVIHIIVVIALVGIILVQRGRSGGLVEALGGVESIFGTKTSNFLVKVTVTLVVMFFVTSISLAYLSKQRSKSLLDKVTVTQADEQETPASLPGSSQVDEESSDN